MIKLSFKMRLVVKSARKITWYESSRSGHLGKDFSHSDRLQAYRQLNSLKRATRRYTKMAVRHPLTSFHVEFCFFQLIFDVRTVLKRWGPLFLLKESSGLNFLLGLG